MDTGSQLIVLPERMKETLGIKETKRVEVAMADVSLCECEVGEVRFQIKGFRKTIGEGNVCRL